MIAEYPSSRKEEVDGTTEMLIVRSVFLQIGSMWDQVLAVDFRLCIHFYEFVATSLFKAKLHFSGGKYGSCMSIFDGFACPTSHWSTQYIFAVILEYH